MGDTSEPYATQSENLTMKTIIKFIVVIELFVAMAATNEGEEKLMKVLAKERKEMKEVFQRENAQLRRESAQLRKEDTKLHAQVDKLHKHVNKQNQEMAKLREMLRQAESKVKKSNRQRDQNDSLEFEAKIKSAIRQADVHSELKNIVKSVVQTSIGQQGYRCPTNPAMSPQHGSNDSLERELRKLMKSEINNFIINEKLCVGGVITKSSEDAASTTTTVQFGYTFPRKPLVSVAFSDIYGGSSNNVYTSILSVSKSSAVIFLNKYETRVCIVSWIACM